MQDSEIYIPPQETAPTQRTVEGTPEVPVPVPVSPIATPDAIATYSIQGVIVTLVIALGKPLLDKLYDLFSSTSKQKAEIEKEKYRQSVRAANLLEESYVQQRELLQNTMINQSAQFEKAVQQLIEAKNSNTKTLENLASGIGAEFKEELKAIQELTDSINKCHEIEWDNIVELKEINKKLRHLIALCGGNREKP